MIKSFVIICRIRVDNYKISVWILKISLILFGSWVYGSSAVINTHRPTALNIWVSRIRNNLAFYVNIYRHKGCCASNDLLICEPHLSFSWHNSSSDFQFLPSCLASSESFRMLKFSFQVWSVLYDWGMPFWNSNLTCLAFWTLIVKLIEPEFINGVCISVCPMPTGSRFAVSLGLQRLIKLYANSKFLTLYSTMHCVAVSVLGLYILSQIYVHWLRWLRFLDTKSKNYPNFNEFSIVCIKILAQCMHYIGF